MSHDHFIALVEFHVIDDNVLPSLREKLQSLVQSDDIGLHNLIPIFKKW
jgi:hypothetical protein